MKIINNRLKGPITTNLGQSPKQLRHTKYAIRNTKKCKTNPIHLLNCSPALLSRPWRGEPNSTPQNVEAKRRSAAGGSTSPFGSRATGHESRLMQNEPNFKTSTIEYQESCIENYAKQTQFPKLMCLKAPTKKCKTNPILPPRYQRNTQKVQILPQTFY